MNNIKSIFFNSILSGIIIIRFYYLLVHNLSCTNYNTLHLLFSLFITFEGEILLISKVHFNLDISFIEAEEGFSRKHLINYQSHTILQTNFILYLNAPITTNDIVELLFYGGILILKILRSYILSRNNYLLSFLVLLQETYTDMFTLLHTQLLHEVLTQEAGILGC